MVSAMGRFRTLEGEDLPYSIQNARAGGRRHPHAALQRLASAHMEEPLGTRLSRAWTPEIDVGRPAEDRSHFEAMGTRLESDASEIEVGAALGSGGGGLAEDGMPDPDGAPIGTLPSVPARIGVNFERVGRPAEITREPYGMLPLEASVDPLPGTISSPFSDLAGGLQGGGVGAQAGGGNLRLVEPFRQFVPPLPASQDLCIVNGFDPRWGEPPRVYRGVVVHFDYARGAYAFRPEDETLRLAFERSGDPRLIGWFDEMARRYASGSMLQPYKPGDGSGRWAFRWIPRRQEVVCV